MGETTFIFLLILTVLNPSLLQFQNRRSRDKRAKETRQRNTATIYPRTSWTSLDGDETEVDGDEGDADQVCLSFVTLNAYLTIIQYSWSRSSSFTLVGDEPSFAIESPPYAFPTSYPPPSEFYPFPCQKGDFSMPKVIWPREKCGASVAILPKEGEANVDTLIVMLGRMSIADEETAQTSSVSVAPFITHLLPAPLPSLINTLFRGSDPEAPAPPATRAVGSNNNNNNNNKHSRTCPRKSSTVLNTVSTKARGGFAASARFVDPHDSLSRKRSGFPKRTPKGGLRPLAKLSTGVSVTGPIPQRSDLLGFTQFTPSDAGSSSSSQTNSPVDSPKDLSDIDDSLFVVSNYNSLDHNIPDGYIVEEFRPKHQLAIPEVMPSHHSGPLQVAYILPQSN